jgi:hypothetical protein
MWPDLYISKLIDFFAKFKILLIVIPGWVAYASRTVRVVGGYSNLRTSSIARALAIILQHEK